MPVKLKQLMKPNIVALLGLILVFLIPPANGFSQYPDLKDLEKAIRHYNSLNFDGAIEILVSVSEKEGLAKADRIRALKFLGLAHLAKGKGHYDKAKETVRKILELSPKTKFDPDTVPPSLMELYYQVAKELKVGQERPDPGIKTIAILDFDNNSIGDKGELDPLGKGFAEMLITDLSKLVSLKVVEREKIQWILKELELQQTEAFDKTTAVRIGKQLGVHSVLFGSFIKFKEKMRIDARLIKTETSELIKAEEITGKADDFIELESKLALKIAKNLDVEVSKHEKSEIENKKDEISLDALLEYCHGVKYMDQGDYKKACAKFEEALTISPNYIKARKRLEALMPLIG